MIKHKWLASFGVAITLAGAPMLLIILCHHSPIIWDAVRRMYGVDILPTLTESLKKSILIFLVATVFARVLIERWTEPEEKEKEVNDDEKE